MVTSSPRGYTATQIFLHWVIAALVVFQVIFGDWIKPAYRAFRRGTEAGAGELFQADVHVYVGVLVLVLAIARLALRLVHGAPAAPAGESAVQKRIAMATHLILYLIIFLMPVSGMMAWYGGIHLAGELHETAKPVIIVVVFLHAAGALFQHFVGKTDVLTRMLRPVKGE
ncbi:cytochrome b [Mesorhizobium sp. SP-1A]|uniref:cytochrome b n=1 Tax=Mesorhizobium sp. SP-1A TaxID=3077840 RepID=UPI0028F72E70|nr:cytochrome b/b6 domain-containing protein [Mesorhizobium sp. SP-1A]